ncbi:3-dehydro-L-gulonate 2-dehydrogenase [Marinomonas sp. A3A]|jgi:3-dehydro-L-gulonate 2-dehydrogenase|uniref:3-dehydro-L-gulonate 2-dehydrogenase n=1 Tax=Marinomonas sp. A3A TaxID=2065312 RepID=UPI001BB3B665|nr:3-dehydro-L-gulonate 2-dehydrogenase [Marinomonas sp. A3A]QUX93388.1 3-dehydro-L-gulonate 2-dehydrogenase [Marinomonas sp. A3A]
MPIISVEQLQNTYEKILLSRDMASDMAKRLAAGFADMANEGVYSHGINRFPVFIGQVDKGQIQLNVTPECVNSMGALEQWDCHYGPGVLNGLICADRAMELAREYGIGMVGMRNSNHWMRGGAYVLEMARQGFAGIAATNSIAVMPAWGGKDHRIGTNPLIMAIAGDPPVLVDCSMSQFSYGQLQNHVLADKELPVVGGYDDEGNLTKDPHIIWENKRVLPMGFWKGSSMSIVLDMMLTAITGGRSVPAITEDQDGEFGVSQFLIAIDLSKTIEKAQFATEMQRIRDYVLASEPADSGEVSIAGSRIQAFIDKHEKAGGIDIHPEIWSQIQQLAQ